MALGSWSTQLKSVKHEHAHEIIFMGSSLSYFMGRNLKNRMKLTMVRIMNIANTNSKNFANSVGIFLVVIIWIVFSENNIEMSSVSYTYCWNAQ